ncbi:MAG: hypothetical protein AB7F22_22705 [Reyranella sp.]|uniref:hypothetical protein n=1 Tax=Reyranella sp. TaxID=1929291 RepID=UPI003D0BA0A5
MAFLADTGVPRPCSPPSRFALRVDHAEWLIVAVYGLVLAVILASTGSQADPRQGAPSDTAVCHQRVQMLAPGLFLLALR